MREMKIEQITNGGLSLYRITDTLGETVTLKPDEAVLVLDFLADRAIAAKLQCSPTTVGRKRKALELEKNEGSAECVNE